MAGQANPGTVLLRLIVTQSSYRPLDARPGLGPGALAQNLAPRAYRKVLRDRPWGSTESLQE